MIGFPLTAPRPLMIERRFANRPSDAGGRYGRRPEGSNPVETARIESAGLHVLAQRFPDGFRHVDSAPGGPQQEFALQLGIEAYRFDR